MDKCWPVSHILTIEQQLEQEERELSATSTKPPESPRPEGTEPRDMEALVCGADPDGELPACMDAVATLLLLSMPGVQESDEIQALL